MTVQEMHIELDILLHKLNSNTKRNLDQGEKDVFLNWAVDAFIKERIPTEQNKTLKGFEKSTKRVEDLQELVTYTTIPLYQDTYDTLRSFGYEPYNYLLRVGSKVGIKYNCKSDITFGTDSTTIAKRTFINLGSFPTYEDLVLVATDPNPANNKTFDVTNYDYINPNPTLFEVLHVLQQWCIDNGIEFRWERYGKSYSRGVAMFIFPTNTTFDGITYDYDGLIGGPLKVNMGNQNETVITATGSFDTVLTQTSLVSNEEIDFLSNSSFGKTERDNVLLTKADGLFYAYRDNSFVATELYLSYIRKPLRINYYLNVECEINPNFHNEIVLNAAYKAAGLIDPERLQFLNNELTTNQ